MCSSQIRIPTTYITILSTRITFLLLIFSNNLQKFVSLSASCHIFSCRKMLHSTLWSPIKEEKKPEETSNKISLFPM